MDVNVQQRLNPRLYGYKGEACPLWAFIIYIILLLAGILLGEGYAMIFVGIYTYPLVFFNLYPEIDEVGLRIQRVVPTRAGNGV